MARYDGLIIPRSYSEYINKTDSATLQQALQQSGVLDSAPTEDSVKAVKSGGVYNALAGKQPTLTFDNVPTEDSSNPVTSDGIYDALGGRSGLTWDSAPTEDSVNPVESGGVFNALATKQDTLTFDDTPTEDSSNPVKSGGVYSALSNFIKTKEENYGSVTVPSGVNYYFLGSILPGKKILGHKLTGWTASTGAFSIEVYATDGNSNNIYIIANSGFSIQNLKILFYYID